NFDGAAPGAKIVSSRACLWGSGCSASALTTGMTDLVENQHVDVINMSISGLGPMNSGGSARALLYNRLINQYGVQLFLAVGNAGPGVNTVGDPSVAVDAVGVGSTVSRATWRANYGSVVRRDYTIQPFSSRGPREDGGLKPNIVAPGSAISTVPLWRPGSPVPEAGYPLPAGYAMMQGTSMASPLAAGAAALLLSAARSNDLGVNPAALRRAIYSAADWIPGAPAHAQGNGLFDVSGAWNLLKRTVDTRSFTVDAPVCTPLSDTLPTPHRGTGIYNRCPARAGGHRAGQSKSYQLKLTRTSGPARGITHRLSWLGNDGTFRSAGNVVLGLNRTASISVTAKPPAGVQSAILRVDDPATPTVDFEVLNTVIAANDLAAPDFSFAGSGSVDRNQTTSFFVNVPAGASALQVNLAGIAAGSQTRFVSIDPSGVPVDETATNRCYPNYPDPKGCNPVERDYQRPMAGIWEFEVEARRTSPALNNPFQISVRAQGATLTPAVLTLPSLTLGQPTPVSWTLRNDFGPVQVTNTAGDLRSAASTRSSIGQGRTQTFEVVVPAGTSRLEAAIGKASDPGADLDLEILLNGRLVKESVGRTAEELISLTDPAAGTYTLRVQGYAVPAGTTGYDYRDLFISTALGSVTVSPGTASVAAGASITLTGSVTARAPVPAGRRLFGELTVHTDQEARIGGGRIDIDAVH
ncbi:MAG TPA: S8 family serine peptidase, partial [Catenuloplanes sp.]